MLVPCPSCGSVNRFPGERAKAGPKCGRCKAAIDVVHPMDVSDDQLDALIANSDVPILVDFWAPWCGPCRSVAPVLTAFAAKNAGRVIVAKVNTDEHTRTAGKLGVQAIPTLAVYRDGRLAHQQAGAVGAAELERVMGRFG